MIALAVLLRSNMNKHEKGEKLPTSVARTTRVKYDTTRAEIPNFCDFCDKMKA